MELSPLCRRHGQSSEGLGCWSFNEGSLPKVGGGREGGVKGDRLSGVEAGAQGVGKGEEKETE